MQTTAVRDGDHWIINGTKFFVSWADNADFALVQAVTDPEKRQRGGITMFIVEKGTPGFSLKRPIPVWVSKTPEQFELVFDNCVVPQANVLGEVGRGFSMGQKILTIWDRLERAAWMLGMMQRALDMCIAWSKQRVTFGRPIADRQADSVDDRGDLDGYPILAHQTLRGRLESRSRSGRAHGGLAAEIYRGAVGHTFDR